MRRPTAYLCARATALAAFVLLTAAFPGVATAATPSSPTALGQFKTSGSPVIPSGGWTNELGVRLQFTVSDPDAGQTLTPWVELRPEGAGFSGACGIASAGTMFQGAPIVTAGAGEMRTATVDITGLASGTGYHWQACVIDQGAEVSSWVPMGAALDFGVARWAQASGGIWHSVGMLTDGSVWSWGADWSGELGHGWAGSRQFAVRVMDGAVPFTGATGVAATVSNSAAVKSDGSVWAWGQGAGGANGQGDANNQGNPVQVKTDASTFLSGVTAISASAQWPKGHYLARRSDGTVHGWGANGSGQIGDGTVADALFATQSQASVGVPLADVSDVAAGPEYSVVLKNDGTVWAWGANSQGQLGDGTTAPRPYPVQVRVDGSTFLTGVTSVAAASGMGVALKSDGTVWVWGLGNPWAIQKYTAASTPLTNVTSIASRTGDPYATALRADGSVVGWGGSITGYAQPILNADSTPLVGVASIASAWARNAIKADGTLWNWDSDNWAGSLGDCGTQRQFAPVQVQIHCEETAPWRPGKPNVFRDDGSTAVPIESWTSDGITNDVVVTTSVSDYQPSQTLTPWVTMGTIGSAGPGPVCGTAGPGVYTGTPINTAAGGVSHPVTMRITGLTSGTRFWLEACVTDQDGLLSGHNESTWPQRWTFGVDNVPPPTTTGVEVTSPTTTAPVVTWRATVDTAPGSGIAMYRVLRSTSSGGPFAEVGTATGRRFTDATAVAGTTYHYRVRPVDLAGNEAVADSSAVEVVYDPAAPAAATNQFVGAVEAQTGSVRPGALTSLTPVLSWLNQAPSATGQRIKVVTDLVDGSVAGLWHFDGPGGDDDSSTDNLVVVDDAPADPSYAAGQSGFGDAMVLDGVDDRAEIASNSAYDLDTFTVDLWFRTSGVAGPSNWAPVVHKHAGNADSNFAIYFERDTNWIGTVTSFSGTPEWLGVPGTGFFDNAWHHVAYSYDGSDLRLYLDGEEVNSMARSGDIDNPTVPITIGNWEGSNDFYMGSIDELRVSSVARSEEEIAGYYAARAPHGALLWDSSPSGAGENLVASCATSARCEDVQYGGTGSPTALRPGARYWAQSQYLTGSSWSQWSNPDWFGIAAAPAPPSPITAGVVTATSVEFTWTDAPGVVSTELRLFTDASCTTISSADAPVSSPMTKTGLDPDHAYWYQLRSQTSVWGDLSPCTALPDNGRTSLTVAVDTANINMGAALPGQTVTGSTTITTSTYGSTGYVLSASAEALADGSDTIPGTTSGTACSLGCTSPEGVPAGPWVGTGWGYTVSSGTNIHAGWTSGTKWARFSTTPETVHATGPALAAETANATETVVDYRVAVPSSQAPGSYATTVTYTVTASP